MLKRYGMSVFALGLSLLSSSAWPQITTEDQPRPEESATDPNEDSQRQDRQPIDLLPALEGIESAIRDLIAEKDQIEAEAQQGRENRDLEAQESMAQWAESMFYATAATVALTLAALFAIVRTLHHTRRAADYTGDMLTEAQATTKAAQASIELTRDMAEIELRAHLVPFGVRVLTEFTNEKISGYLFQVIVKNTGQTPAKMGITTGEIFADDQKISFFPRPEESVTGYELGSNG